MVGEWRNTTLGGFVTLQRGHDLTDSERRLGTVPVMGAAGQNGFHDTALVKGPGIVVGRSGASFGQVHYCETDFWPHNTGLYVTDFRGNNPRFAFYFLKALDFSRYNSGSAQPSLNRNFIYPIEVQVPPPDEQRAIANILGTLDDKIELNRRMNETLEAMARALFKSWFVDFLPVRANMEARNRKARTQTGDPVRAKAEGRDPGLPKPLADLFPDSFEDSELGETPKAWAVGSVDDEFDLTMGQSPPGETYNEACEGLPFYQGRTDFGNRFPTQRVYCTAPTRLASTGDTLISVRAPVGDTNMATERCAIGRGIAAARHKTGSRSYSYQFMHSIKGVFARFEGEGTVFGSIGKKDFHAIPCVMPPRNLVLTFERCISPIDDRIEVNECESRTLVGLRDTLLPKLISGALRVQRGKSFREQRS
jgi:type I restriction enzyme S subunit